MSKQSSTATTIAGNGQQQWEPVILKKSKPTSATTNGVSTSNRQLTEEEKAERQRIIPDVLRQDVQKARLAKKLSQADLARLSNLNVSVIKEYETKKRIFNESEIRKLEKALGCKLRRKP